MVYSNRKKRKIKLKKQLIILSVLSIGIIVSGALSSNHFDFENALKPDHVFRSNIREVSGMHLETENGQEILYSIGDRNSSIEIHKVQNDKLIPRREISLENALNNEFSFCYGSNTMDCKKQEKTINGQWEAIAKDDKNFFLLKEFPSSIMVVDEAGEHVQSMIRLDYNIEKIDVKKKTKHKNSLGEGFVLLKNGHILIAKESNPPSIIEFGPIGSTPEGFDENKKLEGSFPLTGKRMNYVALKSWKIPLKKDCDLSELTLSPENTLYVLSQVCKQVIKLEELSLASKSAKITEQFQLSHYVTKPEGLVIRKNGKFIIGNDTKKENESLFTFKFDEKKSLEKLAKSIKN